MGLGFVCCILLAIPFSLAPQSQAPSGRQIIQDVREMIYWGGDA